MCFFLNGGFFLFIVLLLVDIILNGEGLGLDLGKNMLCLDILGGEFWGVVKILEGGVINVKEWFVGLGDKVREYLFIEEVFW